MCTEQASFSLVIEYGRSGATDVYKHTWPPFPVPVEEGADDDPSLAPLDVEERIRACMHGCCRPWVPIILLPQEWLLHPEHDAVFLGRRQPWGRRRRVAECVSEVEEEIRQVKERVFAVSRRRREGVGDRLLGQARACGGQRSRSLDVLGVRRGRPR